MIIDCFSFFNEFDLLEARLGELHDNVDWFVIAESNKTYSMRDKGGFLLESQKDRYKDFWDKVIYVKVDDYDAVYNGDPWSVENHQRESLMRGINQIGGLTDDDTLLVSDLDEIPRVSLLDTIEGQIYDDPTNTYAFSMSFHAYFINLIAPNKGWEGTVAGSVGLAKRKGTQYFRNIKDNILRLPQAGWHLSWLGGEDLAWYKMISDAHTENPWTYSTLSDFKEQFRKIVLDSKKFSLDEKEDIPMAVINDDSFLPQYIQDNKEKFQHLFL